MRIFFSMYEKTRFREQMYWYSHSIQTTLGLKTKESGCKEEEGSKEEGNKRYSNTLRLERWLSSQEHLPFFFSRGKGLNSGTHVAAQTLLKLQVQTIQCPLMSSTCTRQMYVVPRHKWRQNTNPHKKKRTKK